MCIRDRDYTDKDTISQGSKHINSTTTILNVTYEYEEIADDEYNFSSHSYDYHEEYELEKDLNQSSSSMSLGNMVLGILKKPIEWITSKTPKSNPSIQRGEVDGKVLNTDRQFRPYYSHAPDIFSSKVKLA